MSGFTPINQVRLTNVALVRLKRGGKRFEIACYKNKVVNWRNGVESDLDEVLQIESVFANVSRGVLAKAKDLQDCFGTTDKIEVCKFILAKGQLQVSDKERQVANETLFRDIAAIVSEKCVNAETRRPFTVNMIEKTMKSTLHYAAKAGKPAKKQALEVIRLLKKHIPIVRAQMRVRVSVPTSRASETKNELMGKYEVQHIRTISKEEDVLSVFDCDIQPGNFRALDVYVREMMGGNGLEVMDMHVSEEGTTDITELNLAMSGMASSGGSKGGGGGESSERKTDGSGNAVVDDKIGNVDGDNHDNNNNDDDDDDDDDDDEWPPRTKKSRKKKKKKRRGRGQESLKQVNGETGDAENPAGMGETAIVDLCGYSYRAYKNAYFVLSIYDTTEVNPSTKEPTNGSSKWNIFGKHEKPALWNQGQKGWLVPKKYDEKLDMMGAIKV